MAKATRKSRGIKVKKKDKSTSSVSPHQDNDNGSLQVLKTVMCRQSNEYTLLGDCLSCEHHHNMKCEVDKKGITILTLPHMAASMINRALTTNTSKSLHDTILNYYVYTAICHPVNNIQDKGYIDFKTKFMRGDFAMAGDVGCVDMPEDIDPITYLKPVDGDGLWTLDGISYDIPSRGNSGEIKGKIKNVYYLYEVFENEGLGDLQVASSFYHVRGHPVKDYAEDLVIAVYDDGAVIGKRKC